MPGEVGLSIILLFLAFALALFMSGRGGGGTIRNPKPPGLRKPKRLPPRPPAPPRDCACHRCRDGDEL